MGESKWKLTERSAKLVYHYQSIEGFPAKLKIEINTTEHFQVMRTLEIPFQMKSKWFSGNAVLRTYHVDELMGTKIKALYQRKKGRDLFDVYHLHQNGLFSLKKATEIFLKYMSHTEKTITRAMFEKSFLSKQNDKSFRTDMAGLLSANNNWNFDKACKLVWNQLTPLLPGDPWKNSPPACDKQLRNI